MTDETFKPTDEPATSDSLPTDEPQRDRIELLSQDAENVVEPTPEDDEVVAMPPEPQGEPEPAAELPPAEPPVAQIETPEEPAEEDKAAEETLPMPAPEDEPATSAEEPEAPAEVEPIEQPASAEGSTATEAKPARKRAAKKDEKKEEVVEEPEPKSENMQWYILKVQSNREESIREGLQRRVAIAGLGRFFGDVIVPIEKVTEVKGGKKKVLKRKLYPGYLVVQMEINEDTWFLVRETPGIGDFTGAAGHPTPMLPHEVSRIVLTQEEKTSSAPRLQIAFSQGDRVKINEGTFENFEGEVESIDVASGRVIVMINIFGRSTPVELEYWQIESL